MLAKRRSEQLFTVPWRARGTVGFRADRNVGTLFCPASPRLAVHRAPRRPDPTRPARCVSGFWTRQVYIGFPVFVLVGVFQDNCLLCPGRHKGHLFPGQTDPSAPRPALPRSAPPPRRAPRRTVPPVVCPGFGLDRFLWRHYRKPIMATLRHLRP